MAFTSRLRPSEFIIDDSNFKLHAPMPIGPDGKKRLKGRKPRDWAKMPYGAHPVAKKIDFPLIPRSEWTAAIEEMEKGKRLLSQLSDQAGIESLDQNGTNYCWTNGVITAMQLIRMLQNQEYVKLSAASVAAKIKNFRNEGGWGGEALEYIVENGVVPCDKWPANAIKRQYDTPDTQLVRQNYKITEWWELDNRNFDQLMTCLILGIPVPVGYNWWSHEVCGVDPVVIGKNEFGIRIRNSWGPSYGSNGFAVLAERKATPDDAVAPRVAMAA